MDIEQLKRRAKYSVGDIALHLGQPCRIIARYWSQRRNNIVYDIEEVNEWGNRSRSHRVGEGLLKPLPKPEHERKEGWEW